MKEITDPKILAEFGIGSGDVNKSSDQSLLDKISGYAGKFNKAVEASRLPSLAGGFLQGAGDLGASLANLPLELVGAPKVPHPHLEKYLPQDWMSKGAFLGGELGAGLPGWIGMQSKISKLLPEAQGLKRIGKEALAGAGTGYALGEEAPGGRDVSAALGALVPPTSGLRSSKIAENVVDYRNKISEEYSSRYKDLFKNAEEKGIKEIRKPNANFNNIIENFSPDLTKSIKKFLQDPTVENAHWAQSDLGAIIRKNKGKELSSSKDKAYQDAVIANKKLKGTIHSELSREKGLSPEYAKLTKGYAKDVVPYKYNKGINEYISGELKPSSLINKLSKSDKFMIKQGSKYPELQLRALLNSPLSKIGLGTAAAGLSLPPAYQYISSNY